MSQIIGSVVRCRGHRTMPKGTRTRRQRTRLRSFGRKSPTKAWNGPVTKAAQSAKQTLWSRSTRKQADSEAKNPTSGLMPFQDRTESREGRPSPKKSARCVCPGNQVPFYCPVHGGVENPNWPLLKPLAAILDAIKDDEARRIAMNVDQLPDSYGDPTLDLPPPSPPYRSTSPAADEAQNQQQHNSPNEGIENQCHDTGAQVNAQTRQ
jgi:hypothetical protein